MIYYFITIYYNNYIIFSLKSVHPFNNSMSTCNATAPIDIPTNASTKPIASKFNCVYDTNMCSGASVTISSDTTYASIKCSGSGSSISFSGYIYMPTEIRIYTPSLHTYSGSPANAEMLIVHSSIDSNSGLIVSIPITMTSSSGTGNPDLTAVFQAINTISASTMAINASAPINNNIDVNSIIPAKPYYVYYGTLPYDSCSGNYYYAVFTDPVSVQGPLSNLVNSTIATVPQSMKTNLQKSKTGPITGLSSGSAEEYVLYQVVNPDGDDDEAPASTPDSNEDVKAQSIGINIAIGLLLICVIMGIAYLFFKWVNPAGASANVDADGVTIVDGGISDLN